MSSTDPAVLLIGYGLAVLVVGTAIVVWGYRTDRRQVPFDWDRYWHWWRICIIFAMLGAAGLIPAAWLVYLGRPPHWVANLAGGTFAIVVFAIPGFHWRLWVPIFGFGIPTRTYVRQGLRTLGYNLGLSLGGTVVVVLLGNLLTAR